MRIGNLGFQSPEGIADFRVEWRWMGQSPKEYVVRSSDRSTWGCDKEQDADQRAEARTTNLEAG